MIVIPFYDMLVVPNVTFYFQKDFYLEFTMEVPEKDEEVLFLMTKEEKERPEMTEEDFFPIGILGTIKDVDEDETVEIHTISRVQVTSLKVDEKNIEADYSILKDIPDLDEKERRANYKEVKDLIVNFVSGFPWGAAVRSYIIKWNSMEEMAVNLSSQLDLSNEDKYKVLSEESQALRDKMLEKALLEMLMISKISEEAKQKQEEKHEKLYREEALKKQISILQEELDDMHPETVTDARRYEKKIAESGMNEEARKEAEHVLNRFKQEGEGGHEYGMLGDYLEFITSLSWKKEPMKEINLDEAAAILEEEHFGMKKVKNRILQQIAVMSLKKKQSGSILLFVGPPGTGKTSIGKCIAKALGREYVRISLGGIRDEAEIRGHRRTYIGAMPGRIMDGIKRSGVSNPVVVLDEIDKLTYNMDGDPSSALLEVLDPEQNNTFTDHYLNVPYDLSDVLFICTANTVDTISEPLFNRMEMIEFQGYTEMEKMEIAKRHLLPKALEDNGVKKSKFHISDTVLHKVIAEYTMEAGVRGLKKRLDSLCRCAAVRLVRGEGKSLTVKASDLQEMLDMQPIRHDMVTTKKNPGVVTGLAWTQAGGDVLFIEAMMTPGKGEMKVTGQLGDVMKESVQVAFTLAKSLVPDQSELLEKSDIHIHVPEGAIPKDGPSAGITMTTAFVSMLLGKSVSYEYAMTGEISLQGRVMPIGGLPEKLMAAVRAGVKKVFIPKENVRDLKDVAEEVKSKLEIIPVEKATEVLKITGLLK